jgi:hypothetical protein
MANDTHWWKLVAYVLPDVGRGFRELAEKRGVTTSKLLGELVKKELEREARKLTRGEH